MAQMPAERKGKLLVRHPRAFLAYLKNYGFLGKHIKFGKTAWHMEEIARSRKHSSNGEFEAAFEEFRRRNPSAIAHA